MYEKELLASLGSIRYCKAEVYKNCILGTLRIPQKSEQRQPQIAFGFYLTEQTLYLIEDTGNLKQWVEKQMDKLPVSKSSNPFFFAAYGADDGKVLSVSFGKRNGKDGGEAASSYPG